MREVLLAFCALIGLAGCTAASGTPDPSLPVVQGVMRADITARLGEMRLGSPFSL